MCLAIPGQVISLTGDDPLTLSGDVNFNGVIKEVAMACIPEVVVGQYILVHAGLGISIVDEQRCRDVQEFLELTHDEIPR